MFSSTLVLLTWTTFISGVYSGHGLFDTPNITVQPVDLPLDIEDGNWLIKSRMRAMNSGFSMQIKIDEYIKSENGIIRGKIVATVENNTHTIYYSNANPYERLYVTGCDCIYVSYSNGWSHHISELADDLISHLILVGPSIVFRINKLNPVWTSDEDDVVRGVKLHAVRTDLDDHLKVWFYFKGNDLEELKRPIQIKFIGYDPYSRFTYDDEYRYDYYTITQVDQNFDPIVTLEVGVVCNRYFSHAPTKVIPFPKLTQSTIHYMAKTKSYNAGAMKKEEVYADEKYQISRIKSSTYDKDNKSITTDVIYDYQLGIAYKFTEGGKCSVFPMDLSAPGIIQDSSSRYSNYKLDLNRLLNFDGNYRYLGPVLFEDRDEVGIHAWEVYNETMKIDGKDLANVMTALYFRELKNERTSYTLVGAKSKAHDNEKKMIASQTTIYFNYGYEISSSDSMEKFSSKDCYSDPRDKKTIAFFIDCTDNHCDSFSQYYYQIKDAIKEALIDTQIIAASRIASIEPIFNSAEIIIYVTILDFPNIKNAFEMKQVKLDKKILTTESKVIVDGDEEACLRSNSFKYESFEYIVSCKTENGMLCQRIDGEIVKLSEDNHYGIACSIFMTPLKNVYRYSRESSLDNIHKKLANIQISFVSLNKEFQLTPYLVTDVTEPITEYHSPYEMVIQNTKIIEDKLYVIQVSGITDLSTCYRKCVQSAENDCQAFSFCTDSDRVECLVSTMASGKKSIDSACDTYILGKLTKYTKITSKKFISSEKSVSFESSLEKCASSCSEIELCKSFQYCSGSCSLSGYYTDVSSIYSESCDIYIPNLLNRFRLTGNLVVENTFHTEINLNVDQCAALCYDWNDNDVVCESFNFCSGYGKTPSSCHLSKYTRRDNNDQDTNQSNTCSNYERTDQVATDQTNSKVTYSHTHFGTIYLTIAIFVTTGMISGMIAPIVYSNLLSLKAQTPGIYEHSTFSWTKQLNDERQSVNLGTISHMSSQHAVLESE